MPDRIDETLDAIRQQWFGGAYAATYVKALDAKLPMQNRKALDAALSLGFRMGSNPEVTKQRHAVRAVMLASYLLKGVPLGDRAKLKTELGSKTLADLVTRFKGMFPTNLDFGKRLLWEPNLFSDPSMSTFNVLKTNRTNWAGVNIPQYKFVTHSFLVGTEGNLYTNPEGSFAGWDAISAAVISSAKPQAYGCYGLILKVPKANILTTNSSDQQFQNHIGTVHGRTDAEKTGGVANKGRLAQHVAEKGLEYGGLKSPDEMIADQGTDPTGQGLMVTQHNEVVVIGRAGVSWGGGMTAAIQVQAFFLKVAFDGKLYSKQYVTTPTQTEVTKLRNAAQALGKPLLYLPDNTGTKTGTAFT